MVVVVVEVNEEVDISREKVQTRTEREKSRRKRISSTWHSTWARTCECASPVAAKVGSFHSLTDKSHWLTFD